jgi:hypothetical protein
MKKKIISTILVLLTALSLFPMYAMAATAPTEADLKTAPIISKLEIHDDGEGLVWLEVTVQTPANVRNAIDYFENHESGYNQAGYIGQIDLQYAIDGAEWSETAESALSCSPNYEQDDDGWNGIFETWYLDELHVDSQVKARARYNGADADGNSRYSDWSNVLTLNEKADFTASQWAMVELAEADRLGLIPDDLREADLTKPITRAEFAAVSVRVFEALSGEKANPAEVNPFTDTSDTEVLKAYRVGITTGTSATTFHPDTLLNREQAATMLTRVYKKISIDGWEMSRDGDFADTFNAMFTMPAPFADDADISDWAKPSVYFMAANGIINGVGNNTFAPRATTDSEAAIGYAQATREQALAIATRMVKNLK